MNRFKLCLSLIGFIILTFCAGFRTDYAAAAVAGERVDMSTIGMGFSHLPQELQAAFSAAAGHDDAAYAINRAAVGYHGANMRHNLSLDFSNEGLTVRQENSQWRVRLNKVGYGNDMHVVAPCGLDAAENRVEFRYAGMKEWYINGPMGLEQGFTIDRSPGVNNGGRPLTLELLSSSDFRPVLDDSGTGLLLMGKDDKQVLRYGGLSAVDAAGRRLHAWLESDGLRLLLRVEDVGAIYPLVIDPMIQQQKLTASDGVASDSFGSTVALSADGSTALISAEGSGSYQGAVYVFVRSGATWAQQQKLTASDGAAGDSFGSSVALSADGNTALIGAYLKTVSANFGQGVTYVFVRSGTTWTQQPELTATDGAEYDNFGASVAISADGNTALIGAPYKVINTVNDQGAAYVFVRSGTTWIQQPALIANNGAASDYFGTSVALSGDGNIALIGAEGKSSSRGSVYVFTHGTSWTQLELTASDGAAGDSFGTSVAISRSGTAALVGASYAKVGSNSNQGAAYAFSYSGG
ncbi:MAG TPA: FG-GAP repeat protein, partial [Dissulfurispiraceae bacterium]|nr:FG-GAP repeat protein [Dissulfurispiraceae bacterium]